MKPQTLTDGPLAGQELDRETHIFHLKGQTGAYQLRKGKLAWVPV